MQNKEEVTAKVLQEELIKNSDVKLIDVRSPGEFSAVHINGSVNYPLGGKELGALENDPQFPKEKKLFLVCQSGARASQACNEIEKAGFNNIKILQGGVSQWVSEGLPVVRGKGAISMERQVRIAAGLFVLLSSLIVSMGLNSFILVPIFVGTGLVFSGVTNTCGMAKVLALMPWNNVSADNCCNKGKSCQK